MRWSYILLNLLLRLSLFLKLCGQNTETETIDAQKIGQWNNIFSSNYLLDIL